MILYIICAIVYLFVGALLDRIMGDKEPKSEAVLVIFLWPLALVLAFLLWVADEIVKYFRKIGKENKPLIDPRKIEVAAKQFSHRNIMVIDDRLELSGQLMHYAKSSFVSGANWAMDEIRVEKDHPTDTQEPKP